MSFLKTVVPLFIVLGLLQAAVLALPLIYWRFRIYLNPIERYLFGALLFVTAFIIHPLIVITLITFTIAPTLLSMRRNITARLSTIYVALLPSSLPSSTLGHKYLPSQGLFDNGRPRTSREWLMTVLGSWIGWKTLGAFPFVMAVVCLLALREGKEKDGSRSTTEKGEDVTETGVSVRSEVGDGFDRRETR